MRENQSFLRHLISCDTKDIMEWIGVISFHIQEIMSWIGVISCHSQEIMEWSNLSSLTRDYRLE